MSEAGTIRLLHNVGDGTFEDVTERIGLAGVTNVALVLWDDYDGDGRSDLFVGARAGASRLYRNEEGELVDMTAASGLAVEGSVLSARWFDHDGDGRLDLFVVTAEGSALFHGLEGGFFEAAELPLAGGVIPVDPGPLANPLGGNPDRPGTVRGPAGPCPRYVERAASPLISVGSTSAATAPGQRFTTLPMGCTDAIHDQANLPSCVQASTVPSLGRLYPLTSNLFVAVGGNVGVGTTSPTAKLDVAGTARMTGTLTLAPGVDQALDVATGSIYKGGALFLHTKGGVRNTALGRDALASVSALSPGNTALGFEALRFNSSGNSNTATGSEALRSNTVGSFNTANGSQALQSNTTGSYNTATGHLALRFNTTGKMNTANGCYALGYNTTGIYNTATGYGALKHNTTGRCDTANGQAALYSNATGSFNTATGCQALLLNTGGGSNTACGSYTLERNTTGSANTGVGASAMRNNTTGSYNTASGEQTLYANTTGRWNAAFGHHALRYNSTGDKNTAVGAGTLSYNTTGVRNTATGYAALSVNSTGIHNTASGYEALRSNDTGGYNTATGDQALGFNSIGDKNTATGAWALRYSTIGIQNTATGYGALKSNTTGSYNIALGGNAGSSLTTGNNNIAIGHNGVAGESATIRIGTPGTQTRTFVAGVRGVTTGNANAIPVLIDSTGQLGTISSSRRFKEEIRDMGDTTERLLALRPVVFRYRPEVQSGERPLEYGLIAEEVAEVFPELVVRDEEGQPFTVKYHLLSSMLLNELKKLHDGVVEQREAQARELEELRSEVTRLRGLEGRLAAVEARGG